MYSERHSDLVKHNYVPVDTAPRNSTEGSTDRKVEDTAEGISDDLVDDLMEDNINDSDFEIEDDNTSDDDDDATAAAPDDYDDDATAAAAAVAPDDDDDDDEEEEEEIGNSVNATSNKSLTQSQVAAAKTIEQEFVQFHPVGVLSKQQVCLFEHQNTGITDLIPNDPVRCLNSKI